MAENIRNIGIIAHIDAGKTTTTECFLFYTGKNHRLGEVDSGSATMDWMEQEQQRGITIVAAATTCHWQVRDSGERAEVQINLLDTPGHVDFTVEVERSLRVLDGAIAILCAVKGIEPQTETVWRQADNYHIPRLVYINKMDRAGADFAATLQQLRDKFAVTPLPLYLPLGAEGNYRGNIDVLRREEIYFGGENGQQIESRPLAPENRQRAERAYDDLINILGSSDDRLADLYLAGEEIPLELCQQVLRRLCLAKEIVPVYVGSSLKNKGVQQLLDGVALYLPAPQDLPPLRVAKVAPQKNKSKNKNEDTTAQCPPHAPLNYAVSGAVLVAATADSKAGFLSPVTNWAKLATDAAGPLLALVFKVQYHKEMGLLCYVRIYSGTLKSGGNIFNVRLGERERGNRLLQMHANRHEPVAALKAGEIGVVVGLKLFQTGDTICDEKEQFLLEAMDFPAPVISLAIEPQSGSDSAKLALALAALEREDPTFHVKESGDTGQILLSGMGELHLEVICTRLRKEFKLVFGVGSPRVAQRETLSGACEGVGRFSHEISGVQQEIFLELSLRPAATSAHSFGDNNHFCHQCEDLPVEYIRVIKNSVLLHLETGFHLGYPAINVEVELKTCHYNSEEPYEPGFAVAAAHAIDEAVRAHTSVLLQPIMRVAIATPTEYVGDVISQLAQRHGQIHSINSLPGGDVINATAAMSKLFGYATALRSQTQGRASFSLEFDHFGPVT